MMPVHEVHDVVEGPMRMFLGTVLALAFLRWIVWLCDRRTPSDPHPDWMSEEWRIERRFWVDPR